ncbi:MAG: chromosome partitioning protein ParA [Planctomyces sp.]|nr:chromosome partitioning protein ParA [Planctomyces sp.]
MRRIAVMNQKGGVGKTTSSVNLAAALAQQGRKVCLVDLDPQAHGSLHLGVETHSDEPSVYDVFSGSRKLREVRHLVGENLWVIPASLDLAATEVELVDAPNREIVLRQAMQEMLKEQPLDYIIMDCPPSLGVLTVNALTAADEVFIPLQPHFFALQGLSKLLETTALITRRLNRNLKVSGIMLCLFETGTRLAADVTDDLLSFLRQSPQDTPWANATVFNSRIRRNIKLAEAPSFGQSIFQYQPKSAGAMDYGALATEVIAMEKAVVGHDSDISQTFPMPAAKPAPPASDQQRFAA